MKPLVTDQQVLTWLCVLPAQDNTDKWKRWAYIALVVTLIVADLSVISSSLIYSVTFRSTDLQKSLIGLQQAIAAVPTANMIVVAFFLRHKIPPIFDNLTKIYEKCKNLFKFVILDAKILLSI